MSASDVLRSDRLSHSMHTWNVAMVLVRQDGEDVISGFSECVVNERVTFLTTQSYHR